jgi:hypothetical protein
MLKQLKGALFLICWVILIYKNKRLRFINFNLKGLHPYFRPSY